ncbi:methyl farnesoate epoxidase-like [Copidosoma floridanum]|uniref:methyl farnesoate epoxidase-like n=1 Tax=Copidosoma floridanum TaxID=29053 RepID=UPI0006C9C860|nr:methyl farnesoate epoxidase-like [Copidosoma floridanum]
MSNQSIGSFKTDRFKRCIRYKYKNPVQRGQVELAPPTMILALLCCLLVLLLYGYQSCAKPRNFPPGPRWYPLVGCLPLFERLRRESGYVHLSFLALSARHGPVLGLKLGKQKFVVVHTAELVKRALLRDEFNGRPNGFFFKTRAFGKDLGILFTEGPQWAQHRRFTMRHLRGFGYGTRAMAELLRAEVDEFIGHLVGWSARGPVPMHGVFDVPTLNTLWAMFAGHRFDYEDAKLRRILEVVHEVFRLNDTLGGKLSEMPWLRWLAPGLSGYRDLVAQLRLMWGFLDEEIAEHERSLPACGQPRDLIDAFLMEIEKRAGPAPTGAHIFDRENLLILCFDLFLAGSKTTTDSLATIFCFLGANLEWLEYCRAELDVVVGRDRVPAVADMPALPRNQAFVAEVQRRVTMSPLGITHKATKDTMFEGHFIPKDTNIVLNLYSYNMDPVIWKNPKKFDPGRFLNEKGEFLHSNPAIPYGLGKRRCIGEGMARQSLFLFFVSVIHHFDLDVSEEHGVPNQNGEDGFVVAPKPFYLKLTPRTR